MEPTIISSSPDPNGLYKPPEETAEYLGVTVNALAKMRWDGSGPPYVKIGRRVRYRRSDVDAWLDARRSGTAPTAVLTRL
jgi:excisionase family DNA binding protein